MESQPQNPEFRNNPENFHPCISQRRVFSRQGPAQCQDYKQSFNCCCIGVLCHFQQYLSHITYNTVPEQTPQQVTLSVFILFKK